MTCIRLKLLHLMITLVATATKVAVTYCVSDQDDLETVVPKRVGGNTEIVRLLKGKYRGKKGIVVSLNKREYRADIELLMSPSLSSSDDSSMLLQKNIPYEDFATIAS